MRGGSGIQEMKAEGREVEKAVECRLCCVWRESTVLSPDL